MNFIEQQIRMALSRQAKWEAFDIPEPKLRRLSEAVRSELGLTEFACDGEHWWSSRVYAL
jgi:hypothetical protein